MKMECWLNPQETFFERNRYIFHELEFEFINLREDVKNEFAQIVKDLGGTINPEDGLLLTDIARPEKRDIFHLEFILECIRLKKPIDIKDFCLGEQSIKKRLCAEEVLDQIKILTSFPITIDNDNCSNGNDPNQCNRLSEKRVKSIEDEKHDGQKKLKTSNSSIEADPRPQQSSRRKYVQPQEPSNSPERKKSKSRTDTSSDSKEAYLRSHTKQSSARKNVQLKEPSMYPERKKSKSVRKIFPDIEEVSFTESPDFSQKEEWWNYLPEPEDFSAGVEGNLRNFTENEMKLMLAYLVVNDSISDCLKKRTWEEMQREGYLPSRSIDVIRNNFRNVIKPKIQEFGLPENILKKFFKIFEKYR